LNDFEVTLTRRVLLAIALLSGFGIPLLLRTHEQSQHRRATWTRGPMIDSPCASPLPKAPDPDSLNYLPDVTEHLKIDFQHCVGPLGTYFMPEVNGVGGALFDYDNDGDLDLLLVNSARSPSAKGDWPAGTKLGNRLFRQESDGAFTDVTAGSGIEGGDYAVGCAVADVDNDGDLDVFVTHFGQDRLYRNNANGTFSDVTEESGIVEDDYGTCASFFDYDGDGWLDLIVVNYVHDPEHNLSIACASIQARNSYCGPHKFHKTINRLYHNETGAARSADESPAVRFRDVTDEAGLGSSPNAGFGVVCGDFNRDGRPDFYIANDMAPKQFWINQGGGRFIDEGAIRGVAVSGEGFSQGSMGLATGDVNGDGEFDFVVTNLFNEISTLYLHDQQGIYRDASVLSGLKAPTWKHTGWGVALVDLDHDGDLDLPQVNGLVVPCKSGFLPHGEDIFREVSETILDPVKFWRDYADDNLLLLNNGSGKFFDESSRAPQFAKTGLSGRSLIYGDIDNDGDLDLVVTYCGGPARVYRNELPKSGHWLTVRAIDPRLNRDAYGSEITVHASGRTIQRWVNPGSGYLGSNDVRAHFGLGLAVRHDHITIRWPNGFAERFEGGDVDRHIVLERGTGRPVTQQGPQ
jgi:hypothetical protein